MNEVAQLAFDLGHRPALGRADFLVAPCNQAALAFLDRWPHWPGPALAVHGPAGAGKTHLCQVWRAASGAIEIDPGALAHTPPPELLAGARACVLDDADRALAAGPGHERGLLHLYNTVREAGGHLLLSGQTPPARWPGALADLRSRLRAAAAVSIDAPDDATMEALLVKLFADRQVRIRADVPRYLVARMERSFGAARAVVDAVDRAALAERREITVPLAREVLRAGPLDTCVDQD